MTDQNRNGLGNDSGADTGSVSFSQPNFNESEAIQSLKGALPKEAQLAAGSARATQGTAEASRRITENLSPIEQDLFNRLNSSIAKSTEVNKDIRRSEGPDLLGSLQTGAVRVGQQLFNLPSTVELKTRLETLSQRELDAIGEVRNYEMAQTELDKKIGEMAQRTDLDPFQRELLRGALQKTKNEMTVPTESYALWNSPRTQELGSFQGGPATSQLLEQGGRVLSDTPLSEFVTRIEEEYADLEANDKLFEGMKADIDPIFKDDLNRQNIENTQAGLEQAQKGADAFADGQYLSGSIDAIGGALRAVGGSIEAAWDNPEAVLEMVTETAPQMAAAFNPYTAALTNSGYVGDVYKEALNEFKKENKGELPSQDDLSRMALASLGAGILEVAADKVLVGGTGALKETVDPAVKAAIAGATNNKYLRNAATRIAGRSAESTVTEAATEAGQTALEEVAKGNEVDGAEASLAAVIGGIAGGGFAGAGATVQEGSKAAKTAGEKINDAAKSAKDQLALSPEERLVRDVNKTVKKAQAQQKPVTQEQQTEVKKAKSTIEKEQGILALMKQTPGISEEVIREQEKKVNSLQTRGADITNQKVDKSVFTESPEDQSVDDYLGDVAYQISLDEDGELNESDYQTAIDTAVAKGATDEQVKTLTAIKEAAKTSAEVTDDIIVGSDDWRGGAYYISKIASAMEVGNEASAALQLSELARFSSHMDEKVKDFTTAQRKAKQLGRSVEVLRTEESQEAGIGIPYESLNGKPMFASGDARTDDLLKKMTNDAEILNSILADATEVYGGNLEQAQATIDGLIGGFLPEEESDAEVESDTADTVQNEIDEPIVGDSNIEVDSDGTGDPQFAANTKAVEQELDDILVGSERKIRNSGVASPESDSLRSPDSVVASSEVSNFSSLPESGDVVARAANSTQSPGVKRAIRELGKAISYKERDGVLVEPLDSSIDEKHYTKALELIREAIADADFGKQLKTKGIGQEQLDALPDRYFLADETDVDAVYRAKNEFKEETKVEGFSSDTALTRQLVFGRGIQQQLPADKATLIAKIYEHGKATFVQAIQEQFAKQMSKVKNPAYAKFNSEYASNFADSTGQMVSFMLKGSMLAATDFVMNNAAVERQVVTSQVQAFGNLDSKAEVPHKLMQLAMEIGIGDTKANLVESLGTNAMNIAGVKFNGAHANTRPRHISAVGNIIFNALKEMGIITSQRVSMNKLVWAGAEYDNQPIIDKLKAQQAKQKFKATWDVESWPGNKNLGKYISYNGVVYEWKGKGYRVYDGTSQGNYIETYYIDPEANIGGMDVETYLNNVKGASTGFSKVFGTDYNKRVPAMSTPRKNEGKVKGYPHKKLNQTQKAAQDKQSEQKLFLDKGIMRIKEVFGDSRIMRVAGWKAYDKETTNKVVALTREGKNQTIQADMDGWNNFLVDMQGEADQFGYGSVTDVPFFANFFNSAYQRQFVDSQTFNYQSSKAMHRFAAHHGEQTFDMTDAGQKVAFLISVAQGMGISADKLSSATSISKLDELVEENAMVVGLMQKFENGDTLSEDQMDEIVDFAASEENMHTLLALREYARYRNALEAEQTSMQVVMPIELDGVNNGPITAILQSLTADMDFDAYLRRAGITIASKDQRTAAERYEDKADGLYEEGAEAVQQSLTQLSQGLKDEGMEAERLILGAQTTLKAMNPKLVSLKGGLKVNRNETKSLITKLFYNAGDASLLRAEVGEIMANFYGELQKVIDGTSTIGLERLVWTLSQAAASSKGQRRNERKTTGEWQAEVTKVYNNLMNQMHSPEKLINFELSVDIQAMLTDNMREDFSYGRAKLDGIKSVYESAVVQAAAVSRMTSVGAVFARQRIATAIEARRNELGISRFEELPVKDLEKIYSELGEQLPNLKLDMHTAEDMSDAIPLYNYDSAPRGKEQVSKYALKAGDARAPLFVTGQEITDVGAGGVAASTISVADASTIFGIMEQLNEGFMTVFDGVLVNGLRMDVLAQAANASYMKSLRNNDTFSKILENYKSVTDGLVLEPKYYEELMDALRIKDNRREDKAFVASMFQLVQEEAETIADGIRKSAALSDQDLAVDQFGAVNDKTTVISKDGTVKDAFAELNPLNPDKDYYEKVESDNPIDAEVDAKLSNSPTLGGFVSRNWNRHNSVNPVGIRKRLVNLIKQAGVSNSEYATFLQEGLIDQVLVPAFKELGTLPAIRVVDNATMAQEVGGMHKGAYRYSDNTIFLNQDKAGVNVETLFHELVHSALDIALVNSGRKSKRYAEDLEALAMEAKEFLEKNQTLVTRFTPDGAVTEGINRHIPWVRKDGSVNTREFLSWSLTNYHIMTELAQAKSESNPRGLFGRIWNFIRRLIQRWTLGGDHIQEDSIFSFLFTTAADLAPKAQAPNRGQKGKSLQEDYANINNQEHAKTFEDLAAISTMNQKDFAQVQDVFVSEILPAMENAKYDFLNSHANTAERLNELKEAGADIRVDNFKGAFNMSPVEEHTFQLYRAMMVEALSDNNKYAKEIAELYKNAKMVLKPEDFGPNGQAQMDSVFIQHGSPKQQVESTVAGIENTYNRSEYLASFIALARVNPTMRKALGKAYSRRPDKNRSVKDIDVRAIEGGIDLFKKIAIDRYTGTKGLRNYKDRVDRLSKRMAVADQVGKSGLERKAERAFQKLDYGYGLYKKAFEKGIDGIFRNAVAKAIQRAFTTVGGGVKQAFTSGQYDSLNELHLSLSHGIMAWLPRMVEEMLPTNERNKEFRRLSIGKTRAIAGARDGKTKAVKQVLRDIFKSELTDAQNKALTRTLLDSDLRAIMESEHLDQQDVLALLRDEQKLDETIEVLKDLIAGKSGSYSNFHIRSALSLGTLIATGQPSEEFTLPNAYSIAIQHVGNNSQQYVPSDVSPLIDQLATLVALKHQSKTDKDAVAALLEKPDVYAALDTMLSIYKQDMIDHRYEGNEFLTMKGGFNEVYDSFKDLKMIRKEDLNKVTSSNYSLVRKVDKDASDANPDTLYLVASSTGGLGEYQQGLYSTINAAQSGIKNLDGRTTFNGYDDYSTMEKYTKVTKAQKRQAMEAMFSGSTTTTQPTNHLVPVLNAHGAVTGFQYVVSRKERENILGRDTNFIDILSQSFGRTVEAEGTVNFNNEINKRLKEAYDVAKVRGTTSRFIEVSKDAPTKRGREAYRMMPPEARADLKRIWGEAAFVDSALFDTVYGYRKASIANVLRKHTEDDDRSMWVKELGRALTLNYKLEKPLIQAVLHGEKFMTEVSQTIKDLIVIRGLRVMMGNMLSNTVQLVLQEDMPLRTAIKYQIEGITEARRYQSAQSKIRRLEFEKDIEPDARKVQVIESRIVELQEELAKNPARHLVDHGLLTAIVEDVEEDTNPFGYMNKLQNKVSGMTNRLPKSARSATNALLVNKDSEVYRSLYMFTQLGDFSSRYAALKYRTDKKGEVTADDIDDVVDAFVNYDLPANKYLQYLGDVGQLWFFKYFFRIQNVIIRNTIRNPRRVFELLALTHITGANISTYFDAFFLFNSITNKLGFFQYAEMGVDSLPIVQVYDFAT